MPWVFVVSIKTPNPCNIFPTMFTTKLFCVVTFITFTSKILGAKITSLSPEKNLKIIQWV